MTRLIPCLLFLFAANALFSQTIYYHSYDDTVTLHADNSSYVVRSTTKSVNEVSRLFQVSDAAVRRYGTEYYVVKQIKNIDPNTLKAASAEFDYSGPVFGAGDDTAVIIPTLCLRLPPSKKIQDIIDNYPEQLSNPKLLWEDTYRLDCAAKTPYEVLTIANALTEKSLVIWSVPGIYSNAKPTFLPNDPLFNQQYYLRNTGNFGGPNPGLDIHVEQAWDYTIGTNLIVAVIDDGVEAHEDLAGRVLAGYTAGTAGTGGPSTAANAHGMHTAGIIGASINNGLGIAGIAPNSRILPVNVFPSITITDDQRGAAIEWAWNHGADVLSNSWGGGPSNPAIIDAVNRARTLGRGGKGCPVVFSSGNSGGAVSFPGSINGVITVGSVIVNTAVPTILPFSCTGPSMDLVAPSSDLPGNIRTLDRMGVAGENTAANGNYFNSFTGTSASCPQVAGVALLMLAMDPNATESTIRTRLQQTARNMGTLGFDNTYGYGIVDACYAVRSCINSSQLTGPSAVCTNANYTMTNMRGSVSWTVTGPITIVGSSLNPTVTITRTGNGTATVKATVSPNCDLITPFLTFTKVITAGNPSPVITILGVAPFANGPMDVKVTTGAAPPYKWYVDNVLVSTAPNAQVTINGGSCGSHILRVDVTGPCGTTVTSSTTSYTRTCSHFAVSPNPVSDELTVTFDNNDTGARKSTAASFRKVQIVDMQGMVQKQWQIATTSAEVKLSIGSLRPGTYFLQVTSDGETKTVTLVKK
jgi:hypothetical protein